MTPIPDDTFDSAIKAVAPRKFDVWRKLMVGADARAELAERRANDAESRAAKLMQELLTAWKAAGRPTDPQTTEAP